MNNSAFILLLTGGVLFSSVTPGAGQSLRAYEKKAKTAYQTRNYAAALAYNQVLLEVDSQRVDALFYAGVAARQLNLFYLTEHYFLKIPEDAKSGEFSDTDLFLAISKKGLEKYGEAISYFRRYIVAKADPENPLVRQAKEELDHCLWAMERSQNPSNIRVVHLDSTVNTVQSDFAPYRFADRLYFSSAYSNDTNVVSGTRIFSTLMEAPAQPVDFNEKPIRGVHTSNFTMSQDRNRIYFTICRDGEFTLDYRCQIYMRERNLETGGWKAPQRLPNPVNLPSYTSTQPSIGVDTETGNEILFFASDRKNGKGGMDLWGSYRLRDGSFGDAFPLPFNTLLDDITPFFHWQSKTLFFSSNGRQSMGGFDVFRSVKLKGDDWSEPENMGFPLNGSYDDNYFSFHSPSKKGYFSSNRPGSLCADPAKGCKCSDIYEAQISVDLRAWTFNALDSSTLNATQIELLDLETGAREIIQNDPNSNRSYFSLDLEKSYLLTASLDGFRSATATISTHGINYFATLEQKLYLRPGIELVVRTFNAIDSLPLYGANLDVAPQNGSAFSHQNSDESNSAHFSLVFGNQYVITGSKPDFSSDRGEVSTLEKVMSDTVFLDLYLSPFKGLPLVLYFDNDKPKWNSSPFETTSALSYEETYRAYLDRKPLFVSGYTEGLEPEKKADAESEIHRFFSDSVEANYLKLQAFCEILEKYLRAGNRFEILVAGFASPLALPEYNQKLSERRIHCVENHFREYKGGILKSYIEQGQLVVNEAPKGEQHPHEGVSDRSDNRRISEFSPVASKLRKVTITEIRAMQVEYR